MYKIFLKTAFRNLLRNRTSAGINLLSLTIGLTVSIVIFTIIEYQYSFDHFHKKADRVYRVNFVEQKEWGINYGSQTPEPLHKVLREDYPQIEAVSRTIGPMESNVFIDEEKYAQKEILFVDEHFFKMFNQEWVRGNPEEAFNDPKAVILTESTAMKFFGTSDPMGKPIDFARRDVGTVRGIVKDPRLNTNLPYTMIAHVAMMKQVQEFYVRDLWGAMSIGTTWVLLPENVVPEALATQFEEIIVNNLGADNAEVLDFELSNLKTLHTDDRYSNAVNYTIPSGTIYGLSIIALVVLLTCAINFINLSTAQALKRSQEIGIKKVLGSSKRQLSTQFFLELSILSIIAGFFSLWIAEVLLHEINTLLSVISIDLKIGWLSVVFTIVLMFVITFLAGLYPVGLLLNFKPLEVIRSKFTQTKGNKALVRNSLLTTQFVFAQVLIIIVLVFNSQFNYIKTKDLGFSTENIVMFRDFVKARYVIDPVEQNSAKAQLLESPYIEEVSYGTGGPNAAFDWNTGVYNPEVGPDSEFNSDYKHVEIGYKDMFDLEIIAGNWFTLDNYRDTLQKVVITELTAEKLSFASPELAVGSRVVVNGQNAMIIGVLADFHTDDLTSTIKPSIFEGDYEGYNQGFMKIKEGYFGEAMEHFEEVSTRSNADYTPIYSAYTNELEADYEIDKVLFRFINSVAFLALAIGTLGLYSLISFIAQQKTKELGIRKVIGANTQSLMKLLSIKYVWLILLATVVAAPLGYYGASAWLERYAYRIPIGMTTFVLAFILTTAIAMISVSYRAYRAASANPIKAIRYE